MSKENEKMKSPKPPVNDPLEGAKISEEDANQKEASAKSDAAASQAAQAALIEENAAAKEKGFKDAIAKENASAKNPGPDKKFLKMYRVKTEKMVSINGQQHKLHVNALLHHSTHGIDAVKSAFAQGVDLEEVADEKGSTGK